MSIVAFVTTVVGTLVTIFIVWAGGRRYGQKEVKNDTFKNIEDNISVLNDLRSSKLPNKYRD